MNLVSVDIGCGWSDELGHTNLHGPYVVGVDLNFGSGRVAVSHPVIGDASNLPIRETCIRRLRCAALLEHLPIGVVRNCLLDIHRVMTVDGVGFILVPVDSNQPRNILRRAWTEFPLGTIKSLQRLMKFRRIHRIPGMPHISQIGPDDLKPLFDVVTFVERRVHVYSKFLMRVLNCGPVYSDVRAGAYSMFIRRKRG